MFAHNISRWEKAGLVLANAAIGIGLAIEYVCIRKTVAASATLQRDSDERIAAASARAEEARLETERLKSQFAWRNLPVDTMARLAAALREHPQASVAISHWANDPESLNLAMLIGAVFRLVRWPVAFRACSYGGPIIFEIRVPTLAGEDATAAAAIQQAFTAAGVAFTPSEMPSSIMSTGYGQALGGPCGQIYVGPKPMPQLG
jgi:hypothetical protein